MGPFHLAESLNLSMDFMSKKNPHMGQRQEEKLSWALPMPQLQARRGIH